MESLPALLNPDFSIEQVFGDMLEFELHVKPEQIPSPANLVEWAIWKQNTARLRYSCEFKGIPFKETEDLDGYHFYAKKPEEQKIQDVEYGDVQEALPKPGDDSTSDSESESSDEEDS